MEFINFLREAIVIRTTAGQISASSYGVIDTKEIALFFGASQTASIIDLIDYPIDLDTHKLARFALSDSNQAATITGLLDAIIEIVAIESQPIVGMTEVYCENN
jgi:hypothetical protein